VVATTAAGNPMPQQILAQVVVQDNLAAPAGKLYFRQLPTLKRLFDVRQADRSYLGSFGL
jgi:hypothetical protein